MHESFPFQCIFSASLPTFRKGVHCTKVLHPLTHAVRAVRCVVRFKAIHDPHVSVIFCMHVSGCVAHSFSLKLGGERRGSVVILVLGSVRERALEGPDPFFFC